MTKIIYNTTIPLAPKRLRDIEIGTTFTGKIGPVIGLFVMSYNGTVNLAEPRQTWERTAEIPVQDYKEVDVRITVYDKGEL